MTNNEFLKIEQKVTLIRTPEWVQEHRELEKEIKTLISQFPSRENSGEPIVLDLDSRSVIDVASEMKRDEINVQIRALELSKIPHLYREASFFSPVFLSEHHQQSESFSCTLATAMNAMEALGNRDDITEQSIAQEVGQSGYERPIDLDHTLDYLKKKGLGVHPINNTLDLIISLEEGGVAALTLFSKGAIEHEVLISAVNIEKGKITFIVNDPLQKKANIIPLQTMVNYIHHERPNTFVIEKQTREEDLDIQLKG